VLADVDTLSLIYLVFGSPHPTWKHLKPTVKSEMTGIYLPILVAKCKPDYKMISGDRLQGLNRLLGSVHM
jgi:hypothetical protein